MRRVQVTVVQGVFQARKVATNVPNKQSRTAERGGPPFCGLNLTILQNGTHSFQPGPRTLVNAVMNLRLGAFS